MRILRLLCLIVDEQKPQSSVGTGMPTGERSRICEVPPLRCFLRRYFFLLPQCRLADAISREQFLADANAATICAVALPPSIALHVIVREMRS
jgi:hypothetical protein